MGSDEYAQWREDETVLAGVGAHLFGQRLRVTVRLPRGLAGKAIKAWERDDEGVIREESPAEARARTRAGTLALIGLSIKENSRWDGDQVLLELDSWYIGSALDAADDAGMINGRGAGGE